MIRAAIREEAQTQRMLVVLVVLALAGVLFAVGERPAQAATTFVVDSTGDSFDGDPTDNVCEAITLTPSGPVEECTLRAAIQQANATAGADTINFNIPTSDPGRNSATGVFTISPGSELPEITEAVTIDGYTQPGASPNTMAIGDNAVLEVELSGANAGEGANGLSITGGSGSVVEGLVINRFRGGGVTIFSPTGITTGNNKIEGNYIGTSADGTGILGNRFGVQLSAPNNTVGGTVAGARNLISGNSTGVFIGFFDQENNKVQGNYIGTNKDGTTPLGNSEAGVFLVKSNTTVGGKNTVGGTVGDAANIIAFNGQGVGVSDNGVSNATGNRILSNSIFSNNALGIDLIPPNANGVTPNDPGDQDTGPNNLQNFPVLTFASSAIVTGTLDSTPNKTYTLQFFSNPEKDPSGFGEGKTFLGEKTVTTDTSGNASLSFTTPMAVPVGNFVTATATNQASGDTSEFSEAIAVKPVDDPQPPPPKKKHKKKHHKRH